MWLVGAVRKTKFNFEKSGLRRENALDAFKLHSNYHLALE